MPSVFCRMSDFHDDRCHFSEFKIMLSVIVLISNADVIMLSVIMVHFSEFKMPMHVIFLMSNADVIMLKVI